MEERSSEDGMPPGCVARDTEADVEGIGLLGI